MKELTQNEIESVEGSGIAESVCVGSFGALGALGGVIVGGMAGPGGIGAGGIGGWGIGTQIGAWMCIK